MSSGKITGANPFKNVRVSDSTISALDPALHHASHGHFKGALFRQGGFGSLIPRGPNGRMPLRNAGTKRNVGTKRPANIEDVTEVDFLHGEDDHLVGESSADQLARRFKAFQNNEEHSPGRDGGGEQKFARMFQMPVGDVRSKAAPNGAMTTAEAKQAALAAVPLPPMRSLGDMLSFIQSCAEKDPTGKSVHRILGRINAAVLRKEIKFPTVNKLADARTVLIEVFGVAQMSKTGASPSMRNIYLMLPIFLVNLGRQRSSEQRAQAAARVLSQRAALDMK